MGIKLQLSSTHINNKCTNISTMTLIHQIYTHTQILLHHSCQSKCYMYGSVHRTPIIGHQWVWDKISLSLHHFYRGRLFVICCTLADHRNYKTMMIKLFLYSNLNKYKFTNIQSDWVQIFKEIFNPVGAVSRPFPQHTRLIL